MPVSVRSFIGGAVALALVACGGSDGPTPPPPPVLTTVNVVLSSPSILVGATATASASGLDEKGSPIATGVVSWSTSNSSIASVTSAGVVTGVGAGTASIIATAGGKTGQASITVTQPVVPTTCSSTLALALGEVRALTAAEAAVVCVGGITGASEYVLMPFNSSSSAATTTPFQIDATNTVAVATVPSLGVVDMGRLSPSLSATPDSYSIEAQFRANEMQAIGSFRARPRVSRARIGARAARIPATLPVGSIFDFNTNLNGTNTCTATRVNHPARVVASFPHAAVLIDTLSPPGGFTDAELTAFGAMFDTVAYALDTLYFGKETDIDENGKVVILFTPGINSIPAPAGSFVGGLFAGRDLFSGAVGDGCEGSNEGEMFYMPVPDPQSTINGNYTNKTTLSRVTVATLAHEFQHLINAGRRVYVNNATVFEQVWLNEALSHVAEELLYFRVAGQSPMTNITVGDVRTSQATVDAFNAYEVQNFGRYRSYLTAPSNFSPFSLSDGLEMRGASYTLLRYATDQRGVAERSTFQTLVNATANGRTNFGAVFGDLTAKVRDWAMANFLDDLNIPVPAKYQHPSWNYRSVFTGLGSATLPVTTSPLIGGTPLSLQLVGGGVSYVRFRINNNATAQISATASGQPVPANIDFLLVRTQ